MSDRDEYLGERSQTGEPRREERSVDPDIRDRELQELESGRGAGRDDLATGDEPVENEDIDVSGSEGAETSE
jgi:hypothetical protein